MAPQTAPASMTLGFLTGTQEANGYIGGILVTNQWGRPLEFRVTTAVKLNRVQQVLYGASLETYVYGELIGKNLLSKIAAARLVLTDQRPMLETRRLVNFPILYVDDSPRAAGCGPNLICHPAYPDDAALAKRCCRELDPAFDLREPFTRVREAMAEAQRMGVTARG